MFLCICPRPLLLAVLAYKVQADELGGLAPVKLRLLKQRAIEATISIRSLRPISATSGLPLRSFVISIHSVSVVTEVRSLRCQLLAHSSQ
jgi:hypothetical protein